MAAVLPPVLEALLRQSRSQDVLSQLPGYNREDALARGAEMNAAAPGYAAHAADLARSADFVNQVIAGGMSPNGPVGMPQRIMDELANQYPDKAYPVGTTVVGGGDMGYMPRGPMRDGSLNALTTMLSGLGAPMGYDAPPAPDPRTMMIRPVLSPSMAAGGETPYRHVGGMADAGGENALLQELLHRGGATLDQSAVQGYQNRAAKGRAAAAQDNAIDGANYGIADATKYNAMMDKLGAQKQNARNLITQRAMQEANARSYRRSGMDPRTAALLAAMGGASGGLGEDVIGSALLGPAGWNARQDRAADERMNNRKLDIAEKEASASATKPSGGEAEKGSAIARGRVADINKTSPPATQSEEAIRNVASIIYERHAKTNPPQMAAALTAKDLIELHGVPQEEAKRVAALFSEQPAIPVDPRSPGLRGPHGPLSGTPSAWDDPFGSLAEWMYKGLFGNNSR